MTKLNIKQRILLTFFLISAFSLYFFSDSINNSARRHYLEASEELMYDQVYTLRSVIYSLRSLSDPMALNYLSQIYSQQNSEEFKTPAAKIYSIEKWGSETQLYVTDGDGAIIFHSSSPQEKAKSYAHWRNIRLALAGDYGARSTRGDRSDPSTSILHVSLPIYESDEIVGTLTLVKPVKRLTLYLNIAKKDIARLALMTLALLILLCFYFVRRIINPIEALTQYAAKVSEGQRPELPKTPYGEIEILARTMQETLKKLDGKAYVESYIQTLSHELKSPLAAMRGALELIDAASPEQAEKLRSNLQKETLRMTQMVENILFLSRLENQDGPAEMQNLELISLLKILLDEYRERFPDHPLNLETSLTQINFIGNGFLLNIAIGNLIKNAIEFSPEGSPINLIINQEDNQCSIIISDQGQGIPDYASEKIFDRFYSLPRPNNGRKSSGLGLAIVREIITLHRGQISISSKYDHNGTKVTVTLPTT